MARRIILFELNEVPWRIVDDYVAANPGSALARILPGARCYTSIAADRGHLSPWTTWPTLHRGVNDERHMIGNFGQDRTEADKLYPPIWEQLCNQGVSVGICGTLHTFPVPEDIESYSFYLPDTFAAEPTAFPKPLEDFQAFNLAMARASSRNVDTSISKDAAWRFLKATPKIGIKPTTFAALAAQLVAERRKPWLSTRRRSFQALLAFDLFQKQLTERRPAFSSFFTNHVASAMHRYWAASFPADYSDVQLGDDWMDKYRGEVPWAMAQADAMIGKLAAFADANPEYQLWIVSSMGQEATFAQPLESQLYLVDLPAFMSALDIPASAWAERPAMLPQSNVRIEPDHADAFEAELRRIEVRGESLSYTRADDGFFSMFWGQSNLHDQSGSLIRAGEVVEPAELGLQTVEIEDRSDTTAYHVPQGTFAIYDPADRSAKPAERPEVSVLEIAPALLANFGLPVPDYMVVPAQLTA
jgi:hypothetical protein